MKLIIVIILILPLAINAQDLKKHKWENRLIIISSPTLQNQQATIQKSYLAAEVEGLKDRKLIIYHITNGGYTVGFDPKIMVRKNSEVKISEFQVTLIGLDGRSKYQVTSPQPASHFFKLIDTLPMRKAELKNK